MEQQETKIAKKDLIRKKTGYPGMEIHKSGEAEYLTFPALERLNIVTHMVTSRLGGVSTGDCASFNFSYARDTSREAREIRAWVQAQVEAHAFVTQDTISATQSFRHKLQNR